MLKIQKRKHFVPNFSNVGGLPEMGITVVTIYGNYFIPKLVECFLKIS